MLAPSRRWVFHPLAPQPYLDSGHEHPVLLQVLYNRGVRDLDQVKAFLNGEDAVRENPYRLRDMTPAVQRVVQAVEMGESICVYGDFDADGVTSTVLLTRALRRAGARVGAYIPNRVDEGYGLNVDAIEQIGAKGARLLITVDCGIRSVEEVATAVRLGLDVIVTDHHSIGPELPPALAVVNPRRADCSSGFGRLAGVGVAYRLAQGVLRAIAQQPWSRLTSDEAAEEEEALLDLVAVGTVADLMPLIHENRSLVRRGLAQLRQGRRVGLYALLEMAALQPSAVDSSAISYRIAPRINAAGRLASARLAYDLLRSEDYAAAYDLAAQLEDLNHQRRKLTAEAEALAESQLAPALESDTRLLLVAHPEFRSGIVGLVAGKLVDRYYRPAVVVEQGAVKCRGSARSIDEFDITAALDEIGHLFVRHGGHSRAAGFTIATERLPELREALTAIAERELGGYDDLRPTLHIDAELSLDEIDWALQGELARLEPTGQANEAALLLCRACRVRDVRAVGNGKHLKLVLDRAPGTPVFDAIGFGQGERAADIEVNSRIDVVFRLEVNEWQGRRTLQLNVQDLRTAEGEGVAR